MSLPKPTHMRRRFLLALPLLALAACGFEPVYGPGGAGTALQNRVLVDAPCSGSGVWRRRPDAKWRLSPEALANRITEQAGVLDQGAAYVRPGGRLVYVTCSLFADENSRQIEAFLARAPDFAPLSADRAKGEALTAVPAREVPFGMVLSPAATGTDGFFVAVMERREG